MLQRSTVLKHLKNPNWFAANATDEKQVSDKCSNPQWSLLKQLSPQNYLLGGLHTNCQVSNCFCMFWGICLWINEVALCSYDAEMKSWFLSCELHKPFSGNHSKFPFSKCFHWTNSTPAATLPFQVPLNIAIKRRKTCQHTQFFPVTGWVSTNISLQLLSSTDWFPLTLLAWNGLYLAGALPALPLLVVQVFILLWLWLCLSKGMVTCFFCSETVIGKSELKRNSKGSIIKHQWCWQRAPRHYIPPALPNSGLVFWKTIKCKSGCQYRVISTGPQNVLGWNREKSPGAQQP